MGRKRRLKPWQWLVIGGVLLLSILPDPTDALDAFLPIVEPIIATTLYAYWKGMLG